ncbi:MAG: alpha/beta hydrolase [Acholeplasmatales bacterium]|nr:MAG: alpha/beta hydrolase [Acholeplasmatales bacterium]
MKKRLKMILASLLGLIIFVIVLLDLSNRVMQAHVERVLEGTAQDDIVFIEVDGLRIATRQYGLENIDVIVLVHGFMGNSFDFHEIALELATSHRIIALDLVGFGMSDKPSDFDYSKTRQAELVAQVLEHLDVEHYVLGGHSMGGEVVLRHAHLYPERVLQLILFASAGLQSGQNRVLPRPFYHLLFKNYFIQRTVFKSVFANPSYHDADRFNPMFRVNSTIPTRTLQAFSRAKDDTTVLSFIDAIEIPTLIIYGNEDTWTPPENGTLFHAHLSNSQLVLLEGVGHMPFIEGLAETLNYVQDFLNGAGR